MWKPVKVPNLKYKYEVSKTGKVRRVAGVEKKTTENGTKYESKVEGRELTPASNGLGYMQVKLTTKDNGYKNFYVHLLVLDAFKPTTRTDVEASHKDDDRSNNNLSNLEWKTPSENQTKMAKKNPHIVNNLRK